MKARIAVYSLLVLAFVLLATNLYQARVIRQQRVEICELYRALQINGGIGQS